MRKRLFLLLLAVGALHVSAPTAATLDVGLSDGRPAMFDAQAFRDVNFGRVRLVVPWDAGLRPGPWEQWLQRASAEGLPTMLSPGADASRCTARRCAGPSAEDYAASLHALLERYPVIDAVAGWNEPNHAIQPTAAAPELAAAYFEVAAQSCVHRCVAVAGNLLDVPGMETYLVRYRDALARRPAAWGLHNYYDATYFSDAGLRTMLRETDGPIWFTETGGLVSFRPPGAPGLPASEARAADSLRWVFTMAMRTERVGRLYVYGLWEEPSNPFDSGLLRADGSERPGMHVARAYIGMRPAAANPAVSLGERSKSATTGGGDVSPVSAARPERVAVEPGGGMLRIVGKRLIVDRSRRLVVPLRCLAVEGCQGELVVRVGRWRLVRAVQVPASAVRRIPITVPRRAARRVPVGRSVPSVWTRACMPGAANRPNRCTGRIALRRTR